jgi:hypothetical protein
MATTTPNFGWPVPTSTDLVKDGATAIEGLGDAIDASLLDLKGGTSGQVLAKNSGTDMDFIWVAQDDSNAIQNAIVDAKGDIIAATAADTPARLAVGANDTVLTADSTTATGLKWATVAAGGMTLLSTTTMSGVTTTVSSISGSYNDLLIEVFAAAGTGGSADQNFKFFMNGGTSGKSFGKGISSGGGESTAAFNTGMFLDYNTTTNVNISGGNNAFYIMIKDYASTSNSKSYFAYGNYNGNVVGFITGSAFSTSAITSIGAGFSSASANAGTIKVWGIK